MELIYITILFCVCCVTCYYAFDTTKDNSFKILICCIVGFILFVGGMAMFPHLFVDF